MRPSFPVAIYFAVIMNVVLCIIYPLCLTIKHNWADLIYIYMVVYSALLSLYEEMHAQSRYVRCCMNYVFFYDDSQMHISHIFGIVVIPVR